MSGDSGKPVLIFAKAMNGKVLRVKIPSSSTVFELKQALRRDHPQHIQTSSFRLISRARVLTEKKSLDELNISSQQMLTLVEVEKVVISDPNSPVNQSPEPEPAPVAAHSVTADPKIAAPTRFAAEAPKPDQPAARPIPIAAGRGGTIFEMGESFHKVVRTAAKVLPGQGACDRVTSAAAKGSPNPSPAIPSPPAALKGETNKVPVSAWGQGDSFHKIVRTASKILPGEGDESGSPKAAVEGGVSPMSARARTSPKDPPIREEDNWSGEEGTQESKPNGEKTMSAMSASSESERGEEDVFQTAMAALSEVVAVMEGVKGTVEAAAKKLEALEGSVEQLNGLSQRVAAAEARASGGQVSGKEELLGSLAQRLARVERALNST